MSWVAYKKLRQSLYGVMAARILLLFLLYAASRLAFFAYNRSYFGHVSAGELAEIFLGGARFDSSAIAYVNFLYLTLCLVPLRGRYAPLYQRVTDGIFVATNTLALALNAVDLEYYRFTLKRTTAAVFVEFSHEQQFSWLLLQLFFEHWQASVAIVLGGLAVYAVARATRLAEDAVPRGARFYDLRGAVVAPVALLFMVAACRGGFFGVSHRPITNANAAAYVRAPQHTALVLNTPFSIIRTFDKTPLEERRDFPSEAALAAVYTPVQRIAPRPDARRANVVLIILESFGANAIGHLNQHLEGGSYRGYTPFLDELSQRCLTFTNAFANGLHSIEALPPLVASIPNFEDAFVVSPYANNRLMGLPQLLEGLGYSSAFFHGAPNGSMGFDAFAKQVGFDAYYGMTEYGNDADSDGAWGIWDEEFLQFFAQTLGTLKPPFVSAVFTLTSHSPFRVPERYEGKLPTGPSRAHRVMAYTDMALRRFFETAQTMPMVSRHPVRHHRRSRRSADACRITRSAPACSACRFCNAGDPALVGRDDRPVQHADVTPSVLGYVGFAGTVLAFGSNVFDPSAPRWAVHYHPDDTYELIEGEYALHFNAEQSRGLFAYRSDRAFERNLVAEEPEVARAMEQRLRAIMQQYNNRMRDDRLVAE